MSAAENDKGAIWRQFVQDVRHEIENIKIGNWRMRRFDVPCTALKEALWRVDNYRDRR
jgi:hypothetical protein